MVLFCLPVLLLRNLDCVKGHVSPIDTGADTRDLNGPESFLRLSTQPGRLYLLNGKNVSTRHQVQIRVRRGNSYCFNTYRMLHSIKDRDDIMTPG